MKRIKAPFKVGDLVATDFFTGQEEIERKRQVVEVISCDYCQSGWRVVVTPGKGSMGTIGLGIDSDWFKKVKP